MATSTQPPQLISLQDALLDRTDDFLGCSLNACKDLYMDVNDFCESEDAQSPVSSLLSGYMEFSRDLSESSHEHCSSVFDIQDDDTNCVDLWAQEAAYLPDIVDLGNAEVPQFPSDVTDILSVMDGSDETLDLDFPNFVNTLPGLETSRESSSTALQYDCQSIPANEPALVCPAPSFYPVQNNSQYDELSRLSSLEPAFSVDAYTACPAAGFVSARMHVPILAVAAAGLASSGATAVTKAPKRCQKPESARPTGLGVSGNRIGKQANRKRPSGVASPGAKLPGGNATGPRSGKSGSSRGQCCHTCGTTNTPLWRGGPAGPKTLCNACGVRYMKSNKRPTKDHSS